ncbi:MAG: AI-2E family transporter [Treponema sp.]|nr:AI-2E family transporter [Treponema sp.]
MERDYTKPIFFVLLFFAIILMGFLCKVLSSVLIPVAIAIFMALAFYPIVKNLEAKAKIKWVFGTLIVVLIVLVAIGSVSSILAKGVSTIASEYSKYENRFMSIYRLLAQQFNLEIDEDKSFINNIWGILEVRQYVQDLALGFSSGVLSLSKSLILILIMFAFLLLEIKAFKNRITNAVKVENKQTVLNISQQIGQDVVRFLSIKFFISLATGLLVFFASLIIGLDFPIVWAFLAFVMNFIPTFGSIISTLLTTLFALLQFYPHYGKVIFIFLFMLSVNFLLGNILEPRIEGERLGLSPFAILVSLALWGYLWGFIGMILAVPMTVIVKIFCENIPYLNIVSTILGNKSKKSMSP